MAVSGGPTSSAGGGGERQREMETCKSNGVEPKRAHFSFYMPVQALIQP